MTFMPWRPGQSGNPSGRPKDPLSLAARIRKATNDGQDLIDFAVKILCDEGQKTADRITCHAWLADRGHGKAPITIELGGGASSAPALNYDALSVAELETLLALERKMLMPPAPVIDVVEVTPSDDKPPT